MGKVIPFGRGQDGASEAACSRDGTIPDPEDEYSRGTTMLHTTLDQLAELEGFAQGLPKRIIIDAAHHAADLQDEVNSLHDFRADFGSEESIRLQEMAEQLDILALADYIATLTTLDAHRTPQKVMLYTGVYIDRIPKLLDTD